jgi:hypothetical protein
LNAVTSPIACAPSPDSRCHAVKDGSLCQVELRDAMAT